MNFQQYMANMMLVHQGVGVLAAGVAPPNWPGGGQQAERLDRLIMARYWEKGWRAAWLDNTTVPTAAIVDSNNFNRNDLMQG